MFGNTLTYHALEIYLIILFVVRIKHIDPSDNVLGKIRVIYYSYLRQTLVHMRGNAR